jgi:hypothetical protein
MVAKTKPDTPKRISKDWPAFAQKLAKVLGQLEEDQFLIITAKQSNRYVQFAGQGSYGLRAETVSNHFLDKSERLDRKQLAALRKAGWLAPTNRAKSATPEKDPDGSPNFFVDFPVPVPCEAVAELAVGTLSTIFCVPHPGMLEYEAFDDVGKRLQLGELGLKVMHQKQQQYTPEQQPEIARNLLEALRNLTGIADLDFDGDGDIGIRYGSMVIFARVIDDPPVVHLFSPLLRDVEECPEIFDRLNELNSNTRQLRYFFRDGTIYGVSDTPAFPFVGPQVVEAFEHFSRTADAIDDLLQAEFGGKTMFAEWMPSTSRH